MLRIWLRAMLAAAMFAVVRDHDVLHRADLTGDCTAPRGPQDRWSTGAARRA